jgi:hypothetical protein
MAEKSPLDKLRVLLPHWLEHNHGHRHEYAGWAGAARAAGETEVAGMIERAVALMEQTDEVLKEALARMGGADAGNHHHHHHHHHHPTGSNEEGP